MKKGFDIHNYQKRLEHSLKKLEQRSDVIEENKKSILSFVTFCEMDGMSIPRRERYLGILSHWSVYLDMPFKDVTKEDVINAVGKLQKSKYKEWTKSTYKSMLKRFYKWLLGDEEEYPPCVKWVNTKLNKNEIEKIKNDELLTEKEVLMMISQVPHPRDKALISVLYESGCRIGEIGSLQICNVHIDDHGARLEVNGKTGERSVRVISAVPHLIQWMEIHPLRSDVKSPLWTNIGNVNTCRMMTHSGMMKVIRNSAKECGITKKVNPHRFRHARASFLADHLTEFQMNQHFGWIQGSNMPATYVHMSNRKIDERLLGMQGIEVTGEKEIEMKPQICPRCSSINSQDAKFCMKCSSALNVKVALEMQQRDNKKEQDRQAIDERMKVLLQNDEFRDVFMKLVEKS